MATLSACILFPTWRRLQSQEWRHQMFTYHFPQPSAPQRLCAHGHRTQIPRGQCVGSKGQQAHIPICRHREDVRAYGGGEVLSQFVATYPRCPNSTTGFQNTRHAQLFELNGRDIPRLPARHQSRASKRCSLPIRLRMRNGPSTKLSESALRKIKEDCATFCADQHTLDLIDYRECKLVTICGLRAGRRGLLGRDWPKGS